MNDQFVSIFKQSQAAIARGKFLSRVFGIFSEEIVRVWTKDPNSPYTDLGRPTLRRKDHNSKGYTLDFTLRDNLTQKTFVAEMKCEIEYQNYKYLILTEIKQLEHHKKDAFAAFLDITNNPKSYRTYVEKKILEVDGAILIWGAVTSEGRQTVKQTLGLFDILTIVEMIRDLNKWGNGEFRDLIKSRAQWSTELFDGLLM